MTECIWAAVFAFLIGWLFVNQRRGNRRMSEQLGLPLTYRTDGMEGIDDVSLTVTNGGDNLRLRWLVTNTTNAPISVRARYPRFSLTICGVKAPRVKEFGYETLVYPDESRACVQEFNFHNWRARYQRMGLLLPLPPDCKADQWQLKDTLTGEILTPDVSCGADEASKGEER